MCHQSVGLIARALEQRGIPTISLTSAWSITRAVNAPRAAFLDFPLGHTAGRPDEPAEQRQIMLDVLTALETIQVPGEIRALPNEWSADHSWKDRVMRPQQDAKGDTEMADDRISRRDQPQYQFPEDAEAVR